MAEMGALGPRLRGRREPTSREAREARRASPTRAILKRRHLNARGEMPGDASATYAKLDLSR